MSCQMVTLLKMMPLKMTMSCQKVVMLLKMASMRMLKDRGLKNYQSRMLCTRGKFH